MALARAPYRALFLVGLGYAVSGALVWLLAAMRVVEYPGTLHRILMIEGFEQSFIAGFLLTALGGLTHGGRSTALEMTLAVATQLGVGIAALMGQWAIAHGCFLGSILLLLAAAVIRSRRGRRHGNPPRELIFIVTALVLGVVGAAVLVAGAIRADGVLLMLGFRLVAVGEVLTLVVGVGSILVPKFLGHRSPVQVADVAKPDQKTRWIGLDGVVALMLAESRRTGLYLVVALLLVGSFMLEAAGLARLGAAARAVGVSAVLLGVWKIHQGRTADRLALVLRSAGYVIMAGLWIGVFVTARPLIGEHVVFVAGYGLLTMGIGTRVIVSHGGWPAQDETRLLRPFSLIALAVSLGARLLAELAPEHAAGLLAASGTLWVIAWLSWALGAAPRLVLPAPARPATA